MIREELNQLSTTPRDLRKFGLTVGGIFALLAVWFLWRHKPFYIAFLVPALPLLVLGLVCPSGLCKVYLGWMALALALGLVVSTILLTLFFYFVVTPIGLAARCLGKDFLSRRWDRQAGSHWILRDHSVPKTKQDYERQF